MQILLLAAFLIPAILFLIAQQNLLQSIQPKNRLMQPGLVWLQIIPLFGMVWQFLVITRIAGSIQKEMLSGGEDSILGFADAAAVEVSRKKPTQTPGLIYASSFCLAGVLAVIIALFFRVDLQAQGNLTSVLTAVIGLSEIVGFVFWIVYWVSLAGYKHKLKKGLLLAEA